jgi:hypothetical protein
MMARYWTQQMRDQIAHLRGVAPSMKCKADLDTCVSPYAGSKVRSTRNVCLWCIKPICLGHMRAHLVQAHGMQEGTASHLSGGRTHPGFRPPRVLNPDEEPELVAQYAPPPAHGHPLAPVPHAPPPPAAPLTAAVPAAPVHDVSLAPGVLPHPDPMGVCNACGAQDEPVQRQAVRKCRKCGEELCEGHATSHQCQLLAQSKEVQYNSDWGRNLLAVDDLRMAGSEEYRLYVETNGFSHSTPSHTPVDELLTHRWQTGLDMLLSEKTGERVTMLALTGTASDATNLVPGLASFLQNRDNPEHLRRSTCVLVEYHASVAARGTMAHYSCREHFRSTYKKFRPAEITDEVRSSVGTTVLICACRMLVECMMCGCSD